MMFGLGMLFTVFKNIGSWWYSFGTSVGLWIPVTVGVAKTDLNTLFILLFLLAMFITIVAVWTYVMKLFVDSSTNTAMTYLNGIHDRHGFIVGLSMIMKNFIILVFMSIFLYAFCLQILKTSLAICAHQKDLDKYIGAIIGVTPQQQCTNYFIYKSCK